MGFILSVGALKDTTTVAAYRPLSRRYWIVRRCKEVWMMWG